MEEDRVEYMYLSPDEARLIQQLRSVGDDLAIHASNFLVRPILHYGRFRLVIQLEDRESSESDVDMTTDDDNGALQEIVENAARIKQKSAYLDETIRKNAQLSDSIISKLIQSHPKRKQLEKFWSP